MIQDNRPQKVSRAFWIVCWVVIISLCADLFFELTRTSTQQLQYLWKLDLQQLHEKKILPKEWNQIKEYNILTPDDLGKELVRNIEVPIETNPNGTAYLEILVLGWDEDGHVHSIIQYDLIDSKSKRLIFELGRTYKVE